MPPAHPGHPTSKAPKEDASHERTDLLETANGSPPPAINLGAAPQPDRGLAFVPEPTDVAAATTFEEPRRFVSLGWPRGADGRRHGEDRHEVAWLPEEVNLWFPEGWLRRVGEAQEQPAELDEELGRIPPPNGASQEASPAERVRYWELVEAEHRYLAREQAILAALDAEADPR